MDEAAAETYAPRERRHQKVVRRILEGATEAIVAGGFDALSMNKLAAALDYTPGALYRYFPSKDALIATLVTELVGEIGAEVRQAISPGATPLVRVAACAYTWRRFAERDPHRFGLLSMLLAAPRVVMQADDFVGPALAAMLQALQPLATALADAEAEGLLAGGPTAWAGTRTTDRALTFFAGLQGVLLLKKQAQRAPELIDLDRLFVLVCRTLLVGWGAPADAVSLVFSQESP